MNNTETLKICQECGQEVDALFEVEWEGYTSGKMVCHECYPEVLTEVKEYQSYKHNQNPKLWDV